MGEVTDNHKVVFMFEFVQKLNEINSNDELYSPACIIRNLRWNILIDRKSLEEGEFEYVSDAIDQDTLAVKVQCEGESSMWCSYARIRLTVISQKDGVESFSREFENLFSSLNPVCGYSDFMAWDELIDTNNGYVKDNILKIQAHIVADIPPIANADVDRDLPAQHEDWLALFEESLNDKIVGRISAEFIRMNNVIEKSLENEEISEKLINAVINPLSTVISTEIQSLEKKLEKFCRNHITRVVSEFKNLKLNEKTAENEANDIETNDVNDTKADCESKKSCAGQNTDAKKVSTVEEETVPVSVLKIMKELIVEQQRTSFGWMPSMYGTRAAYYKELHSYEPDSAHDSADHRVHKGVLKPLTYETGTDSDAPKQQQEGLNIADRVISVGRPSSELNRENPNLLHATVQKQFQNKSEAVENSFHEISNHSNKPIVEEVFETNEMKVLFCGKNDDGEVEVHKVTHPQHLINLSKKYKSYKLLNEDDF